MRKRVLAGMIAILALVLFAWALTRGLERVMRPGLQPPPQETPSAAQRPAVPERHITATLFYSSSSGEHLVAMQREVPFGEGPVEQGRQIVLAQLTMPPAAPLVATVPQGATLRGFYISERGEAFVDLGPEIVSSHPGGSAAELLTVYAIVNAVAANLPAVTRVQILVGGQEVDTLVGHVDLRRPLRRNDTLVKESN